MKSWGSPALRPEERWKITKVRILSSQAWRVVISTVQSHSVRKLGEFTCSVLARWSSQQMGNFKCLIMTVRATIKLLNQETLFMVPFWSLIDCCNFTAKNVLIIENFLYAWEYFKQFFQLAKSLFSIIVVKLYGTLRRFEVY